MVYLKKHYIIPPTKEWEFKPSLKMVKTTFDHQPRRSSLKTYDQTFLLNKERPQRLHMYPYQEVEKENRQTSGFKNSVSSIIKEEMRNIGRAGFAKPNYEQKIKGFSKTLSGSANSK